jgi:hypothetical protein
VKIRQAKSGRLIFNVISVSVLAINGTRKTGQKRSMKLLFFQLEQKA